MEKYQKSDLEAKKYIKIADHILTITYPLINDPKLLLAVMENIFLALAKTLGALLYFERLHKRIPPFHDNFESKFNMFKLNVANKFNFSKDYIHMLEDMKNIIVQHKKSPVEFVRKDVFVICSDNYNMKTLSIKEMKKYVAKAKVFIADISNYVNKNERIIR